MERKMATIRKIDSIHPIEGADLIDFPEIKTLRDYYEEIIDGDWSKRKRIVFSKEYLVLGHSHQSY